MSASPLPSVPGQLPATPRKGLSTGCIVALVIGVVLGGIIVIGILVALAVPAANGVMKKAQIVRTKAAIKDVQLAIRNFYVEYDRAPLPSEELANPVVTQGRLIKVLMGADKKLNPREILYIDPPIASQGNGPGLYEGPMMPVLVDSWGNALRVAMTQPMATDLPDPEHPGSMIKANVLIWSAGPDGNFDTWKDNIASWKP